jgi:hypothetical protein
MNRNMSLSLSLSHIHTHTHTHTSVNTTALILNITYLFNITYKREWLFSKHYSSKQWVAQTGGRQPGFGVTVSSKVLAHVLPTHNQVGPQVLCKTIISCHNTEQHRKPGKRNSPVPSRTHVHLSIWGRFRIIKSQNDITSATHFLK